ncbi:MAG TPA: hypothetical protein VN764_00285 [Polyangiaceae bacterium]|nr:hypothetical protein [Polyangiaceae bacterium]
MKKKQYQPPQLKLLGSAAAMTAFDPGFGKGWGAPEGPAHGVGRRPGFDELS